MGQVKRRWEFVRGLKEQLWRVKRDSYGEGLKGS
jgi:hypothetical protein